MRVFVLICILVAGMYTGNAQAGVVSTPVKETVKYIIKKFGAGSAGKTADSITRQTARAVSRYGDDCLPLLRQVGPEGFRILDRAGNRAPDIIRLYRTQGDRALWIIRDPGKTNLFLRHGDDAARAMLRHPGMADNMIRAYGTSGANALNAISRQNAQRLSRLSADGTLSRMGRIEEILGVIGKYGDKAMEFIWRHKGPLCVTAVLATFLNNPEMYIDGVKELVVTVGKEIVAEPLIREVGRGTDWTLIIVLILSVAMLPFIVRKLKTAIHITRQKPTVQPSVENKDGTARS